MSKGKHKIKKERKDNGLLRPIPPKFDGTGIVTRQRITVGSIKPIPLGFVDFLVMLEEDDDIVIGIDVDTKEICLTSKESGFCDLEIVNEFFRWKNEIKEYSLMIMVMREVKRRANKETFTNKLTLIEKDKVNISLGKKLRELREKKHLTKGHVGSIIGVKWKTIDLWEKGLAVPAMRSLEKLANLYEYSLSDLKKLEVYT